MSGTIHSETRRAVASKQSTDWIRREVSVSFFDLKFEFEFTVFSIQKHLPGFARKALPVSALRFQRLLFANLFLHTCVVVRASAERSAAPNADTATVQLWDVKSANTISRPRAHFHVNIKCRLKRSPRRENNQSSSNFGRVNIRVEWTSERIATGWRRDHSSTQSENKREKEIVASILAYYINKKRIKET